MQAKMLSEMLSHQISSVLGCGNSLCGAEPEAGGQAMGSMPCSSGIHVVEKLKGRKQECMRILEWDKERMKRIKEEMAVIDELIALIGGRPCDGEAALPRVTEAGQDKSVSQP